MELTLEMMLVMAIIAVAVFLFIVEWVRVDVVAILIMVSLPILGLVTPSEAFSGFGSSAVISIIAIMIISSGLDRTGVINRTVQPVVKFCGESKNRIVIALSVTISIISSFMQNVGAAALFLPAIKRISKSMNIPISRLLMPIGFSAILGGTVTMVGSSPLILLNDLLAQSGLEPFGLFDVTPIGIALVLMGIAYFILLGKYLLPQGDDDAHKESSPEDLSRHYDFIEEPHELKAPPNFSLTAATEPLIVAVIKVNYHVNIVAIANADHNVTLAPAGDTILQESCDIGVYGTEENVTKFAEHYRFTVKNSLDVFRDLLSPSVSGNAEAVVAPRSEFEGTTLLGDHFRKKYYLVPLAIYRSKTEVFTSNLESVVLKVGDAILLHGSWERLAILKESRDFIFTTPIYVEAPKSEKALLAVFWLALSLTMVTLFKIPLPVSLMTGALGCVLSRIVTIDEAYRAVDWRTVFLLAGLIPLGIATHNTGADAWIADGILSLLGEVTPLLLFIIIAILSTAFTLVISNVGAAVLLVPLVINMALKVGADPRMAALCVAVAVSNSFILPTHQVNALYMGPGRYRSVDFIRAGLIQTVLFIVVLVTVMYLFYGIGA